MINEQSDKQDYSAAWKSSFPEEPDDGFDVSKFEPKPDVATRLKDATKYAGPVEWARELKTVTQAADDTAENEFPNQARDRSVKNAFRHALGTGRLAQLLGADSGIPVVKDVATGTAKAVGYVWESLDGINQKGDKLNDTRHDLNANAIGADDAKNTKGRAELVNRLKQRAAIARRENPPEVSEQSPGYFTYTK